MNINEDIESLKNQTEQLKKILDEEYDDDLFKIVMDKTGIDLELLENQFNNYEPKITLNYKKLNPEAKDPYYNYISDSGFDLYATETIIVSSFGRALIPTGLSFDIKDGYEIQVRSKSGLAINQGLFVMNSPGTIDNGYIGEIKVIVFNSNKFDYTIEKGTKIAQAVLCPVVNGKWVDLKETNEEIKKDRNNNGFGSTGI